MKFTALALAANLLALSAAIPTPMMADMNHHVLPGMWKGTETDAPMMMMDSKDTASSKAMASTALLKRMMEMPNPDTSSTSSTTSPSTHDSDSSICTIDTVTGTMTCPADILLSFRRFLHEKRMVHGMGMGKSDHEAGMQGSAEMEMDMGMDMARK